MNTVLSTLGYIRRGNEILMIHKNKKKDIQFGKWNGLGGKIEGRESPEKAIIREIWEESNLEVFDPDLRGILLFPNFSDKKNWLVFVYVFYKFRGVQLEKNPEGDLFWIQEKDIFSLPIWDGDKIFIPWVLDKNGPFFSATFLYEGISYQSHEVFFYRKSEKYNFP